MKLNFENLIIDPEFESLLPAPSDKEKALLEEDLLKNGLQVPLVLWKEPGTENYILIDGHNRYEIMKKNFSEMRWDEQKSFKIMYENQLPTRESVKQWIIQQQLGRRNIVPFQKIMIAEKFRTVYEEQARQNKSANGGDKKPELTMLTTPVLEEQKINVREKLAKLAGVSEGTYRKGKEILDSKNEKLINAVISGKKTINSAFNEIHLTKDRNTKTLFDISAEYETIFLKVISSVFCSHYKEAMKFYEEKKDEVTENEKKIFIGLVNDYAEKMKNIFREKVIEQK